MKTIKYIFCLSALLTGTACNNEEVPTEGITDSNVVFTATLQSAIAVDSRTIGDNKKDEEALPYIYDIRIRKVDVDKSAETELFNVRSGNKGTLDMEERNDNGTKKTAFIWTDKTNSTDFYAWTVPTGVTIDNTQTEGIVNFGSSEGEGNNPTPKIDSNKLNEDYVTPLEVFVSAYKAGKYTDDPSVSLPFKHLVSKISIQVYRWDNTRITDDVTITFPYISKEWKVKQTEDQSSTRKSFAITEPNSSEELSLPLKELYQPEESPSRIFYLPPMNGTNYSFDGNGDFEITYGGEVYYGTLKQTGRNTLDAGEYMILRIDLNKNYGTGVGAWIKDWDNKYPDIAYANPYRGIYTVGGLKVLKEYLASAETNKELPDSLYIDGTTTPGEQKIIRLYNDLDLSTLGDEYLSLVLEKDMTFDGLGHTITVPNQKSLFGDITTATGVEINNVRLLGEGQLASSLLGVKVYNCHANGSGNLVGTASGSTSFDFCSAEKKDVETSSATLIGTASAGSSITITNSFVATDATSFASSSGTVAAQNSFIIGSTNYYWASNASSGAAGTKFTIDAKNVTATTVGDKKLIDLLNEGSNTNSALDKKYWVYVYNKSYPVMRVK